MDYCRKPSLSDWIVLWGWEGTVDYRFALAPSEVSALRLGDAGDVEERIGPRAFDRWMHRLTRLLRREPRVTPGGSPLISALSVQQLHEWNPRIPLPEPRFWGIFPPVVTANAPVLTRSRLLEFGVPWPSIKGSLCLDDLALSRKHVLSVFQGRMLDRAAFLALKEQLDRAVHELDGQKRMVLALGGLNKADPRRLLRLVRQFRSSKAAGKLLFVGSNSFKPLLRTAQGAKRLAGHFRLLQTADVVSLSGEEVAQLGGWLGLDVKKRGLYATLQALGFHGLAVCHHHAGVVFTVGGQAGRWVDLPAVRSVLAKVAYGVSQYLSQGKTVLTEPERLLDSISGMDFEDVFGVESSHEAAVPTAHSRSSLSGHVTGLGSRFDGYLSALLPDIVREDSL